jgi:hypothetical protein
MSRLTVWLRAHPAWRAVAAGLAAVVLLLVLAHARGGSASSVVPSSPVAPPPAIATVASTPPAPSTSTPLPDTSQAAATARSFLFAYFGPDDTPQSLRTRLRPYDSDRLDAVLQQGAAGGVSVPSTGAAVSSPDVLGLAPDGRLVVTAQVTVAGSTRYVELYLAVTPAGWRVDEVAL